MGVPAFFRWLSRKYPSVIVECIEQRPQDADGELVYCDSSLPNPNGVEFDNLYLDMNGIIHPCTHPEDKPAPKDEDEMMVAIFECIDRLFRIVRPRKLLYMAIDGVAPRAKMNQQRSRRFRASKETQEKIEEVARIRSELLAKGAYLPPERPKEAHFDSNCITPGTPFMDRLSKCLHYYIHDRLNNDPGWKGIKVILSDANVPGEGEHKIMDYIRRQRAQPDHDPNTQHVLCGADADLIMLGLATHEPNFTIIREEFKPNKPRPCDICGQLGHEMKECTGSTPEAALVRSDPAFGNQDSFIFVRLSVLREYLEKELQMPNLPFPYDFERALDDWVFMCFFVGNDFLPHLPSLEIREGAVDRLVNLYKKCVFKTRGWITDSGDVNLDRVQLIMDELGQVEDEIFRRRHANELNFKAREKAKKRQQQRPNFNMLNNTQFAPMAVVGYGTSTQPVQNAREEAANMRRAGMQAETQQETEPRGRKRTAEAAGLDEEDDAHDEVRLWEEGFKERYYESKFEVARDNLEFRYRVALQYVRGLCWVLRYYYQGCASWKWYFPYHYAPFASDFVNVSGLSTKFEKGTQPFRPLEQLMGVFPAASSQHVPKPWATLMSDPFSPIIDFYPTDFKIDLNGKKFAWQGVALLPFVDETRLFKALEPYYKELTQIEIKRNIRGHDRFYVSTGNKSYEYLLGLFKAAGKDLRHLIDKEQRYPYRCEGVRGDVMLSADCVCIGGQLASPVIGLPPVLGNQAVCVRFQDPQFPDDFIFPARRLQGAVEPGRVLKPGDLSHQENRNWRPQIGMVRSNTVASLEAAGRRMLGHHLPRDRDRSYGNVPPPQHQQHNRSQSGPAAAGPHRGGYVAFNQQGYNQGYPSQSQGYPSQNQGYPSQNQGFNRQNQGYQQRDRFGNQQGGYQQNRYNQGGYQQRQDGYQQRQDGQRYNQNQNQRQGYSSQGQSQGHQGQSQGYQGQSQAYNSRQGQGRSTWR
ncbi:5'-3' exoribonuclease 2 homolog [Leguminivora glycinivorella]|uniref:5'-3' exoribonuclease 2 homolog n=1 Tax=Leguminivora glycinivorella TaxID=1035111 RepID=UPI00200FFECA|nr:5'-3' exoribonuclease 2 homolog [Leguminivora glycinivorella]